jgi:Tfp pilus assembly protein PilX
MVAIDRFILLVRDLRRDQRGIAVPTALMALIASFALASVAVMSTVDVQQGTHRDHDSKEAIAAADAGANIAMLRLNRYLPSLSTAHPCIGPAGEYQTATAGWCPSTAAQPVGSATYSYRISAFTEAGTLNVVSVGASGSVSRRVNVNLKASAPKSIFAKERLIAQDEMEIVGTKTRIDTDFGTNGRIKWGGSPTFCGNERVGPGMPGPTPSCGKQKTEGSQNLPPISVPSNLSSYNDDCRLELNCTGEKAGQKDTYSKAFTKNNPWVKPPTRKVDIPPNEQLTMGGLIYWVCKLEVQGSLYMPALTSVKIYVSPPTQCGMKSGDAQVIIGSKASVESDSYNPLEGRYEVPQIFVIGDGQVKMEGSPQSTNEVMIYAPNSEITIGGEASWTGMLAGKTIKIHGNPTIKSDPNLKLPEENVATLFERTRYVECTGATASPPNANC